VFNAARDRQSLLGRVWVPRLHVSYASELAIFGTWPKRLLLLAMLGLLVAFPQIAGRYGTGVATVIVLAIPGAVALNLLQGVAGQVSAGNPAFLGIGAIATAFLVRQFPGISLVIVLPIAGITAAAVGALVALPALRVRGLYLLISTLALQYIIVYVIYYYQIHSVGQGGFPIPIPSVAGFMIDDSIKEYYFYSIFAVASLWLMANILRTRVGRAWIAVRDSDIAAEIIGVNVTRAKIEAFVISSFMIGVQGSLLAYHLGVIQGTIFTFDVAVLYISIVIIGGMGSVLGTVLGTVAVIGLPYFLDQISRNLPSDFPGSQLLQFHIFDLQTILYGALIMIFLLFAPYGLVQIWHGLLRSIHLWPFSRERSAA
jgi:branched-chain amino acid transport system permease protein